MGDSTEKSQLTVIIAGDGSTSAEDTGDDEADVSSQEEVLYILYEDRMGVLARTRLELAISYRVGVISQIE